MFTLSVVAAFTDQQHFFFAMWNSGLVEFGPPLRAARNRNLPTGSSVPRPDGERLNKGVLNLGII